MTSCVTVQVFRLAEVSEDVEECAAYRRRDAARIDDAEEIAVERPHLPNRHDAHPRGAGR